MTHVRGMLAASVVLAAGAGTAVFVQSPEPSTTSAAASPPPEARISNGLIHARVYLPDAARGFCRSTRFDWAGIVASLQYDGHEFYGPWFTGTGPVRDFVYRDADIVAGPQSAVVGPAEEFQIPLGYAAAKPGDTFVKVGVGVLRRSGAGDYSAFNPDALVDSGTWTVETTPDRVDFAQQVDDPASGYGYDYRKTISLTSGRPELVIDHSLRNTGRLPLVTNQYNHNFLVLDEATTGPDFMITLPFTIRTPQPPDPALAEIRGNQIVYTAVLQDRDRVFLPIQGFGGDASDYDVRVENRRTGAGFRVTADRPMARLTLWSIRSVLSVEPFIDIALEPGSEMTWRLTYTYFAREK